MVATTDAIVTVWPGTTFADTNNRIFAQVFSGDIQASRIDRPIAVAPINDAQVILGEEFILEASDYTMSSGEAHESSEIFVFDTSLNFPFDNIITSSGETSVAIPAALSALLVDNQTYFWQVRYRSVTNEVSRYSAPATFVVNRSEERRVGKEC